ncbi:cbb3-type cytochrome oxidase assembly protein CcoS [Bradyrhizobium sp. BR13661]|uniref:cbb3-type cytochrome oxidase assembly protein CcoS n=1 Tax=Bradyrhizobium sp. BR13661 TaxID=2940622 RepID=UPI002476E614|nr:cbb3-type cytochrome oxidase assembly protein CcoS [Bradyrhizobium sp. BR13661]
MVSFLYLIPISVLLGAGGLCAFIWSLRSGQYQDLEGARYRILGDEDGTPL